MTLTDDISMLDVLPKMKMKHTGCPSLKINGFSLQSLILSQSQRDQRRQLAVITLPIAFQRYN